MNSTATAPSFLESVHPQLHLLLYVLAFWFLYRTRLSATLARAADVALGGRLSRGLVHVQARYAEIAGDWVRAGELHHQVDNHHRAIECFEHAEDYERCAEICHALGRNDYAAEWLELAGDPRSAGDLFGEALLFDKAAGAYLDAGAHLRAAGAFVRAGAYARAAELYSEHGAFELAGEAFEKSEQFELAAECFEKTLAESGDLHSVTTTNEERQSAARVSLRAADCFNRAGKPARALDVLARGEHHELAANVAERLGDYREAARLYLDSNNRKKAAAMYALAGDPHAALRVEAEHHLEMGRPRAGAECLLRAGDPERAAEVFQSLGEVRRAADCYVAAGNLELADERQRHHQLSNDGRTNRMSAIVRHASDSGHQPKLD